MNNPLLQMMAGAGERVVGPQREIYNMPPGGPGGMTRYREMTIDELLLENRVIFLVGEITDGSATALIMRMLYLQNTKKESDIHLYINSPGGSVDATLAIYDTIRFLECEVNTYCIGHAMSGAAVVLAAGSKGRRYALPNSKVMIHQPFGGLYGQTSDVKIQAEQILSMKKKLNEILAKHTGQTVEQVTADAERDKYFTAEDAKAYGLVDQVLESVKDKREAEQSEQKD